MMLLLLIIGAALFLFNVTQHLKAHRYHDYYGPLSARRDGAGTGCPGVVTK